MKPLFLCFIADPHPKFPAIILHLGTKFTTNFMSNKVFQPSILVRRSFLFLDRWYWGMVKYPTVHSQGDMGHGGEF